MKTKEIVDGIGTAVEIAIVILVIVGLLRTLTWITNRIKFRKGVPLVFHPLTSTDQKQVNDSGSTFAADDLVPKLIAYIAEDPPGTLVPGGLGASAPATSASAEKQESDWWVVLLTLAFARSPGYHVQLSVVDAPRPKLEAAIDAVDSMRRGPRGPLTVAVTIFYQPGGRVVAATTIKQPAEDIIDHIGAFCVYQVGTQRAVRRRTPRWEQWHSPDAYRLYRKGLHTRRKALEVQAELLSAEAEAEQASREAAELTDEARKQLDPQVQQDLLNLADAKYKRAQLAHKRRHRLNRRYQALLDSAVDQFALANQPDPANLLPGLARAAIFELRESKKALPFYKACRLVWPEQIEIDYRIAAHDPRHQADRDREPMAKVLRDVKEKLRVSKILSRWLRTWSPEHWAPGERRYWASWLKPDSPRAPRLSMRTKRREYLTATHSVLLTAEIWKITRSDSNAESEKVRGLLIELDTVLSDGRPGDKHALRRLFHPEIDSSDDEHDGRHSDDWHGGDAGLMLQVNPRNGHPAKRIGWLAHFNAACCFSVALKLRADLRPWECSEKEWEIDCCAGALRQLAKVLRHPYSQLDPSWLRYDPDLDPLKDALRGLPPEHIFVRFAETIGLPIR